MDSILEHEKTINEYFLPDESGIQTHTKPGDNMVNSIWTNGCELPHFPALEQDLNTDILIIGGGLAGLLCAYRLEQAGVDYALIEADRISHGVTRNTTAKITAQHGLIYHKLLREFGPEKAAAYYGANRTALETYRKLAGSIDCDYVTEDNYVYSLDSSEKLEKEFTALKQLGIPADYVDALPLPFPTAGAIRFRNQARFHPMKFVSAIAKDLRIYEHTPARAFEGNTVLTGHGTIRAEKIIVATHFPILNKHGSYFLKMYQHRSYVLALEHAADVDGMYVDNDEKGLSFRRSGGLLLLGGGGHRTGKKGGGWADLERIAAKYYPNAREVCRWATQDCMTLDGMPYIGQYSKRTPNLYVAAGFNKWGMTSSMVAAQLLCDLVQGRENPWEGLFSPSRSILRPQLAVNAAESACNLITPTVPRCPHLGCALKWNSQEHSWDCPCHGSRFGEDGTLLDNPATGNLKSNKK